MGTIPILPATHPYPSLPLLVFWDSGQQKPCCETGLEHKLALKTKTSVKKKWTYTSEFTSQPKIIQKKI